MTEEQMAFEYSKIAYKEAIERDPDKIGAFEVKAIAKQALLMARALKFEIYQEPTKAAREEFENRLKGILERSVSLEIYQDNT